MTTETQRSAFYKVDDNGDYEWVADTRTGKMLTVQQVCDLLNEALTPPAVADKHWHDDINDAVAFVESLTVERMETAITACQSWDTAGLVNEGLVTDMATAYLQSRKAVAAQGVTGGDALEEFDRFCRFIDGMHMGGFVENDFMCKAVQKKIRAALIKAATAPNACADKGE